MKIFLGGINGVGKTTILSHIQALAPGTIITYGSRDYMQFLGLPPNSYDALRALPEAEHKVLLQKFVTAELKKARDQDYIFDGHFVVFDQGESPITKVSEWITSFDLMVLIESDAQNIYDRVCQDQHSGARKRTYNLGMGAEATVAEISHRLTYTRNVATRISEWFSVPLVILPNITATATAVTIFNKMKEHHEKSF